MRRLLQRDLAILHCCNYDYEFGVFYGDWVANFPGFGREKNYSPNYDMILLVMVGG